MLYEVISRKKNTYYILFFPAHHNGKMQLYKKAAAMNVLACSVAKTNKPYSVHSTNSQHHLKTGLKLSFSVQRVILYKETARLGYADCLSVTQESKA